MTIIAPFQEVRLLLLYVLTYIIYYENEGFYILVWAALPLSIANQEES